MTCPHLDYRQSAGEQSFDAERAYCTVVGKFVQPMRADVCNDRYGLDHAAHCEIFREHEGIELGDAGELGDPARATGAGGEEADE